MVKGCRRVGLRFFSWCNDSVREKVAETGFLEQTGTGPTEGVVLVGKESGWRGQGKRK